MKAIILLLLAATLKSASIEEPTVEVFMPTADWTDMQFALQRARKTVSEVYAEIGVRVVWRHVADAPAGCHKTPMRKMIIVSFRKDASENMPEKILAYAMPHQTNGPCVTILQDRIESRVRMNPTSTGYLLGHVLAHEMGHVLQQVSRHSDTGLMKGRWSNRELMSMSRQRLRFTEFDVELIRNTLGQASFGAKEESSENFLRTAIRTVLDAGNVQEIWRAGIEERNIGR